MPHAPAHLEPAELGKAQIADHEIGPTLLDRVEAVLAGTGDGHAVTEPRQPLHEKVRDVVVVFHDDDGERPRVVVGGSRRGGGFRKLGRSRNRNRQGERGPAPRAFTLYFSLFTFQNP